MDSLTHIALGACIGEAFFEEKGFGKFAFHYYLEHPADNVLVVQRGRFDKWDWDVVKSLWKRIKGN